VKKKKTESKETLQVDLLGSDSPLRKTTKKASGNGTHKAGARINKGGGGSGSPYILDVEGGGKGVKSMLTMGKKWGLSHGVPVKRDRFESDKAAAREKKTGPQTSEAVFRLKRGEEKRGGN